MLKYAALNTSSEIFFLDHICPLASLLNIPLLVTAEENAILTSHYYPEIDLRYMPDLEFRLQELTEQFDGLIECNFWAPHLKHLLQTCFNKPMKLIFCPHGQSDKNSSLAPYSLQENVLLYGPLLFNMLQELHIPLQSHTFIGNYRHAYYRQHQTRQQSLAHTEIFAHLNPENKTLLYAPTWQDSDSSSTFFDTIATLLGDLPSHWNLILKIHPLLPSKHPAHYYRLSSLEKQRPNFQLVHQFPLIYPILDKIDAYLGDYSSIGYDALTFQKPLFFLSKPHIPSPRLHTCGPTIPSHRIFHTIDTLLSTASQYHPMQTKLYKEAFAQDTNLHDALQRI